MPSPRLSLASTFLSSFSPLLLRKEIQPFHLCLSLCVVLDLGFPPLNETFCHQGNEKFSHPHVFSFWYGGTFSRPCSLPGVLSVKCVCCNEKERIMTNEMKLFWSGGNSFGVFNNGSISDCLSILFCRCLFKTKKLFPSYVKKRKCAKMIFSLTAASAGLSSWKEKNNYWMFFSNCNRSKQNVTVGSRFQGFKK